MEDNLRYFFSAVFQGFAALIAIGAIFIIFKIQEINNFKFDRFNQLVKNIGITGRKASVFIYFLSKEKWQNVNLERSRVNIKINLAAEFYKCMKDFYSKFDDVNNMSRIQRDFFMKNVNNSIDEWKNALDVFFEHFENFRNINKRIKDVLNVIKMPSILSALLMFFSLVFLLLIKELPNFVLIILAVFELVIVLLTLYNLWGAVQKILIYSEE